MDVLQFMRAFRSVVQAGSLTGAAERLQTSTANISRMLTQLEAHLRIRLLNRTTRRVALTEAGKRYLARCEQILTLVDTAESEVQQQHNRPMGELRIHAMHGLGQHYVVDLITRYRKRYPEVTFKLTLSNRLPDLYKDGYDMSILLQNSPPQVAYCVQALGSVDAILCASPGYLASHAPLEGAQDLRAHACLSFCDGARHSDDWQLYGPSGPVKVPLAQTPLRVDSEDAMRSAIVAGLGIGLLPAYAAAEGLRNGSLLQVLPSYHAGPGAIYAIYPSRQQTDVRTSTWIHHLMDHMPGMLAGDVQTLCA
ncbi:LysR family transcriptional regulator [Pseudomonas putida]|uniref:LysR family transcriptional regulator n=1 Tax=Pseudomonas TaxID=286 RepID=UPI0021F83CAC|nr:LysR family transcriptional regulator [Pseudomonas putida]